MPTRKQKRRRQKERRHDYEYVYVDEEGNEVLVDEETAKAERTAARNGRAKPRTGARAGQRVERPSWRRVGKRGLIFAPLMFVTVMLIDRELEWWQWLVQTAWLMAIFLPFSYFMDSFMYRRSTRRTGDDAG